MQRSRNLCTGQTSKTRRNDGSRTVLIFLDTEYTDEQHRALVSVGMVTEDEYGGFSVARPRTGGHGRRGDDA